ncbi:hypothetical protein CDFC105_64369 [Clostridioides difficile]|nr:hypothetical protein CDFC105_64369 [Clostridioides difficile]
MEIKKMKACNYFDVFGVKIEEKLDRMLEFVEYEDLEEITGGFFMKDEKMFFFYHYKKNIYDYINIDELLYDVIIIFDDIIQNIIEQETMSRSSAKEKIKNDIYTEIYQMFKKYVKIKECKDNFIKELKNYQGKILHKSEIDDLVVKAYSENFEYEYENEIDIEIGEDDEECNILEYNLTSKWEECLNNIYLSIKVKILEEFLCIISEVDVFYHKNDSKFIEELEVQC